MKKPKKILIAISAPYAASRQRLRGIYRYIADKEDWDIVLVRTHDDLTPQIVADCEHGEIAGAILSFPLTIQPVRQILASDIPIVLFQPSPAAKIQRTGKTTVLFVDNEAIGRMAANYLLSLGIFKCFAYIPDEHTHPWSTARGDSFRKAVEQAKRSCEYFDQTRESLSDFLLRIPKPIGIFAVCDYVAAQVINTCHKLQISSPNDVSILGVDDDELICESIRPALSTILVDCIRQGFVSAKELDALMSSSNHARNPPPPCKPLRIIERESTLSISPTTALVDRALKFIKQHATEGIGPADIARSLHVSRRLLDLRFAESGQGSLASRIRRYKLLAAKRLLRRSTLSDAQIAIRCGFGNVNAFRNAFRHETGGSPRSYHRSSSSPNP